MTIQCDSGISVAVCFGRVVQQQCSCSASTCIDSLYFDIKCRAVVNFNISVTVKHINRAATRAEDVGSDLNITSGHTNFIHHDPIVKSVKEKRKVLVWRGQRCQSGAATTLQNVYFTGNPTPQN